MKTEAKQARMTRKEQAEYYADIDSILAGELPLPGTRAEDWEAA